MPIYREADNVSGGDNARQLESLEVLAGRREGGHNARGGGQESLLGNDESQKGHENSENCLRKSEDRRRLGGRGPLWDHGGICRARSHRGRVVWEWELNRKAAVSYSRLGC